VPNTDDVPAAPLVVQTKLRPRNGRELVPRPDLVNRLAGGAARRLTVVRAPAGWGKTTLLSAWATSTEEPRPFAWLALDGADARPARFWTYVIEALRTLQPELGEDVTGLLIAPGVDIEDEVLPRLLNEIAELPTPAVLALDDYHLIDDAAIHDGMAFVIEHLPPTLEIAMTTRAEPPLPLARLRVRGELLEIDAAALRFTPQEADRLLNGILEVGLASDGVETIHRRTEGWAAGLYLAGLSLRSVPRPAQLVGAFSGDERHIVDYLGSEVLAGVREELREFMLRTSVLQRLTAPACDAVAGTTTAARLLEEIERANLFLVALDDRRERYRYHHLFAELLRRELERTHPGLAPELHRRAARWFMQAGDVDHAIRHTIAAGDHAAAVDLIAEHWAQWLLARGEDGPIDAWLRALPRDVARADPRLCVAWAITRHSLGTTEGVYEWLDGAEAALAADADPRLRVDLAGARAAQDVIAGDVEAALAAAGTALAFGTPSPWLPVAHGARAHALRWRGDTEAALAAFEDYRREGGARGQILNVVSSFGSTAVIHAEHGHWAAAVEAAAQSVEQCPPPLAEHWIMGGAHNALALIRENEGDAEAARAAGDRAVELMRRGGVPGDRANTFVAAALRHLAAGEREDADSLLDDARSLLEGCADPGAMVLRRLEHAERRLRPAAPPPAQPALGDPLSDRELAVLRLLATQLSQREIGIELYVSLNTVKTHTRHVFRKLGASGRHDAVSRAREHGLI
jgi:LuxR family maltose regulon positive regulatory protein